MYDSPHQFEPLLPSPIPADLLERAAELAGRSLSLGSAAHASARAALAALVRSMNSYYSNRIEGQGTHPVNIEKALHREFSDRPDIARLQRLALAHIEAEAELEAALQQGRSPRDPAFLIEAHRALYSRLQEADRRTEDQVLVVPGQVRSVDVEVGRHVPPAHSAIPAFLARMKDVYDLKRCWERELIVAACAHHRAAWVHPFLDGNGRAIRLQTHAWLWPLSGGLWSCNRGLARQRDEYYARLSNADHPRQGNYDGRGNPTTRGLVEWIGFFLAICEDQVAFMSAMLKLDDMKRRIEALVHFRSTANALYRRELILPLHYLFASGPLTRGEFIQMTGLGERTARKSLAQLLKDGLVGSATALGPVSIAFPLNALQFLFPGLYPEVDAPPE